MTFSLNGQPNITSFGAPAAYTLGSLFSSVRIGDVLGVLFWKDPTATGTHIGTLWSAAGANLAQVTVSGETASGWQYMPFATPYTIAAGTNYVISVLYPNPANKIPAGTVPPLITPNIFNNPLSGVVARGRYNVGAVNTYPPNATSDNYFVDLLLDVALPITGIRSRNATRGSIGYLKGIALSNDLTSLDGEASFGRHLATCTFGQSTEGSPAAPSIPLKEPGFWRLRWGVNAGTRRIYVRVKQEVNGSPRPSLKVKANPSIGIMADVEGFAPAGTDWVTIGPVTVTPSSAGVVWVELWNNYTSLYNTPTFFDHLDAK